MNQKQKYSLYDEYFINLLETYNYFYPNKW